MTTTTTMILTLTKNETFAMIVTVKSTLFLRYNSSFLPSIKCCLCHLLVEPADEELQNILVHPTNKKTKTRRRRRRRMMKNVGGKRLVQERWQRTSTTLTNSHRMLLIPGQPDDVEKRRQRMMMMMLLLLLWMLFLLRAVVAAPWLGWGDESCVVVSWCVCVCVCVCVRVMVRGAKGKLDIDGHNLTVYCSIAEEVELVGRVQYQMITIK